MFQVQEEIDFKYVGDALNCRNSFLSVALDAIKRQLLLCLSENIVRSAGGSLKFALAGESDKQKDFNYCTLCNEGIYDAREV